MMCLNYLFQNYAVKELDSGELDRDAAIFDEAFTWQFSRKNTGLSRKSCDIHFRPG